MRDKKKIRRCLRAIGIAKILFEYEGYHTRYLESLENSLKELLKNKSLKHLAGLSNTIKAGKGGSKKTRQYP